MTEQPLAPSTLLEGRGLSKRYGATQALEDAAIRLERGRVTALAGGNGAGKSTLIRLLSGVEQPDAGVILRDGAEVALRNPHSATRAGIFCVYQDQPFVGPFEVFRQVHLGYENRFRRMGVVSDALMRRRCAELLDELGLSQLISPMQRMDRLSPASRELVALTGVVAVSQLLDVAHPVILLDEPTSALTVEELDFLVEFIKSLKERSALLFVSHRVSEVLEWAEALYILRDGRNADFMTRETMAPDRVYGAMGGGRAEGTGASRVIFGAPTADAEPSSRAGDVRGAAATLGTGKRRLEVEGIHVRPDSETISFVAREGEIIGLSGVEGSGKEEFLRMCAGLAEVRALAGMTIRVDGKLLGVPELRDVLRNGVIYLSGERQRDGVFGKLTITENLALSRRAVTRTVVVDQAAEKVRARAAVAKLGIKAGSIDLPLQTLSGGNQQKVLLGRCLELAPRVLLLDNVTRGVDMGAKASIYALLGSLAAEGAAIVLASDDLDELISVSDRIVVFKGGSLTREFDNSRRDVESFDLLAAIV
jgi:ABC-type sugar transport system ATPase subunit